MENTIPKFGSVEVTRKLDLFFWAQAGLVAKLRDSSRSREESRWAVIYPLLYTFLDTAGSFKLLAQQGKVRDCYVLARVMFEILVNALYIAAKGDLAAQRAVNHARQKAVRDLDRTIQVGGMKLHIRSSTADTAKAESRNQQVVAEFTSSKGREITSWTAESVAKRIEEIGHHFGENVSTGLLFGLSIYRHSSDIAHGTLFAALFSLGLTTPAGVPSSPAELEAHFCEGLSMLFLLLGLCCNSFVIAIAPELGIGHLVEESKSLVRRVQQEPWAVDAGV